MPMFFGCRKPRPAWGKDMSATTRRSRIDQLPPHRTAESPNDGMQVFKVAICSGRRHQVIFHEPHRDGSYQ